MAEMAQESSTCLSERSIICGRQQRGGVDGLSTLDRQFLTVLMDLHS